MCLTILWGWLLKGYSCFFELRKKKERKEKSAGDRQKTKRLYSSKEYWLFHKNNLKEEHRGVEKTASQQVK